MMPSVGAELGGPKIPKIISSLVFVFLWVFYIMMSILKTKGIIDVTLYTPPATTVAPITTTVGSG